MQTINKKEYVSGNEKNINKNNNEIIIKKNNKA